MNLTGSEIVVKVLENMGIDVVAGIPGGANLPLYNALYQSTIKHVLARHEQGACFIAHGIARTTGETGVCIVTSGPGVTNAISAIADAKMDSIPMVIITGQVPFSSIGSDAFQEVDTYSLTIPITKHNFLVRRLDDLIPNLYEAFRIANSGRPGPVVVDIPKNVLKESREIDAFPAFDSKWHRDSRNVFTRTGDFEYAERDIQKIVQMLDDSKRPVMFVGGGATNAGVRHLITELSHRNQIPVASTLMGLGSYPHDDPLYLGMIGMHGAKYTNHVMHESDLLIALGVRFDDRATGMLEKFCPNSKIIHIDIERAEISKNKSADHFIVGTIKDILPKVLDFVKPAIRTQWIARVLGLKQQFPLVTPPVEAKFHPDNLILRIAEIVGENAVVTTDVGQHQMWVAQVYPFTKQRQLLTSGGLGTMGFGLPAAIGAAMRTQGEPVLCFTGDGSLLMNIQELATLHELDLNVKVILLNNECLGMVRQQQELFYNQHYMASKFEYVPNFEQIARGFDVESVTIDSPDNLDCMTPLLRKKGPALINLKIKQDANVFPMVPPGAGNLDMIGGEQYE